MTGLPERLRLRLLMAVGVVAVSFAAILIRVAEGQVDVPTAVFPALALAFWRSAGGSLALLPFAARSSTRPTPRGRWALMGSGLCLAVHFALFIGAFAYTSVASAVVFVTTSPVFVGLGSWVFLKQPPTRRTWWGIAVAVLGALVVGVGDAGGDAGGSNPLLGDLMALGGAIAVSGYLLIGQRQRAVVDVATYGAWVYGVAAVVLAMMAGVTGAPLVGFTPTLWVAIGGLILGPQLLGHTIFNLTLNRVPATTVAVVVLSEPIGAGLLAFLLLDEVPSALLAVGGPLMLVGVYLASTGARRDLPQEALVG